MIDALYVDVIRYTIFVFCSLYMSISDVQDVLKPCNRQNLFQMNIHPL